MTADIVHLKRKPRALRKSFSPVAPYTVTREDQDDSSIRYVIFDERPNSYRFVSAVSDDYGSNPYAKHDAEQIARALNMMVQLGKETLPKIRERDE